MTPENERHNMDSYILTALEKLDGKVEGMAKELNDLKVQIASHTAPARPCEFFKEHAEEHRRQEEASRSFWYQRLGAILDALWKPILALLLLGAILSGQLKIDVLRRADSPNPTAKEAQK